MVDSDEAAGEEAQEAGEEVVEDLEVLTLTQNYIPFHDVITRWFQRV